MSILGPLAGEPPEPMTKEDYERVRKRIHAAFNGLVSVEREELQRMIAEIAWLKKRLRAVEFVLEPLVEGVRERADRDPSAR